MAEVEARGRPEAKMVIAIAAAEAPSPRIILQRCSAGGPPTNLINSGKKRQFSDRVMF